MQAYTSFPTLPLSGPLAGWGAAPGFDQSMPYGAAAYLPAGNFGLQLLANGAWTTDVPFLHNTQSPTTDEAGLVNGLNGLSLNPNAREYHPRQPPSQPLRNGYCWQGTTPPDREGFTGFQGQPTLHGYANGRGPPTFIAGYSQHGAGFLMHSSNTDTKSPGSGKGDSKGRGPGKKKKGLVPPVLQGNVKRTIYICDVDQQVTEAQLASVFSDCGDITDCRVCGDPNSAMRFAFIEFTHEKSVKQALGKTGQVLAGFKYPLRVLPSKTAIVPVNLDFLPRSEDEREKCMRTVYAANIDKRVEKSDVKEFFTSLCGKVSKIRLLGDHQHASRIAFVEFENAGSAKAALNCSGALLGSLPIRVSPSKTPVRPGPRDHDDKE